jgi:DNA polymerase elongation subunit (family B)
MGFDLETTSLEPKDGRIFMIGIKTNKGYHKVIECSTEEEEKNGLIKFFDIIDELKPSIIGGYNSFNFDWYWIKERCDFFGLNIQDICKTLHSKYKLRNQEGLLKLGSEVEPYNQIKMWGYNVIDIQHAVRRAQAINSNIKSSSLKYITKHIKAEAPDRVYIDHENIGPIYTKKEEYWLNIKNGNYRRANNPAYADLDKKYPDTYIKIKGDELVERYLDDDLEETLRVNEEFNQGTFLLSAMVPTTYERVSTMGTASLWNLLMYSWSYKYNLSIPLKDGKREFVGGLSRLLRTGYSKNVLKLDFSSLYPSIQLVHDIFPECDISGSMKAFLSFFRTTRITYKNLAGEFEKTDKKKSLSYDRKQLPIKIFINSMFGAISAPLVFPWADINKGEQITCTGRQYLRQMTLFFLKKGYTPLVCDTDGMNFSMPDGVEDRVYVGKGLNWKVKKDKEYRGYDADVAEFNDIFMRGEMALDCDGTWASCINLSRKNYATMEHNGKIKLTGNSIKSKKLQLYIEEFFDKAIRLLLEDKGSEFVDYYYEYLQKIYTKQIPLSKIAQRAKVKLSVKDYIERCNGKTKAGGDMSRMAHMELVIKHNLHVNLGETIYYVNNGTKASQGDVQKVTKKKSKKGPDLFGEEQKNDSNIELNCYILDSKTIETNPDMLGDYNVPRAISAFNNKVEPLLIVFKEEVRKNLLVSNPEQRGFFTKQQCELINGRPFEPKDEDDLNEDLLRITDDEIKFWQKVNIDPNYIYEKADESWRNYI